MKMAKLLRKQGILVAHKNSKIEEDLGNLDERIESYQNYLTSEEVSNAHVRLSKLALTTVAMWSEMHDTSIVLADIPGVV